MWYRGVLSTRLRCLVTTRAEVSNPYQALLSADTIPFPLSSLSLCLSLCLFLSLSCTSKCLHQHAYPNACQHAFYVDVTARSTAGTVVCVILRSYITQKGFLAVKIRSHFLVNTFLTSRRSLKARGLKCCPRGFSFSKCVSLWIQVHVSKKYRRFI